MKKLKKMILIIGMINILNTLYQILLNMKLLKKINMKIMKFIIILKY